MNATRIVPLRRHSSTLGAPDLVVVRCNGNCNQGRLCDCVPNTEDDPMTLPAARRINAGRTFASPWDPVSYGAAIELPAKKSKVRDIAFGLAMAAVVCATLYVLFTYGKVPA